MVIVLCVPVITVTASVPSEMPTFHALRAFVSDRLTVAVEEIIGMFERTMTEYEEELDRHRRLLSTGTGESPDTQPITVSARITLEQQDISPSLHEKVPQPQCIKQEPEELWISQKGEQLQGADISQFQLPTVSIKSEDEEESHQSSQLHQTQTEENTEAAPPASGAVSQIRKSGTVSESCGGSEPAFDMDVAGFLNTAGHGQLFLSQCCKTKTEVLAEDQIQMIESQLFSDKLKDNQAHKRSHNKKVYKCPACSKTFKQNAELQRHITCHTGERPFNCSECGKTFRQKGGLHIHMRKHTGEKPFSCLDCGKKFTQSGTLSAHMRIHTGEKPFSCSLCKKRYNERGTLVRHMRVHTGEKPFLCSLCGKRFSEKGNLNKHKRIHTGEKPFSCTDCEKKFNLHSHLKNHKCPVKKRSEGDQARQLRCPKVTVQLTRHTSP